MANTKQKFIMSPSSEFRKDIKNGLKKHGKVKVVGLGIFETRKIPARAGRNPQSGEIVKIRSYTKIKFRPTASLKKAVCKK